MCAPLASARPAAAALADLARAGEWQRVLEVAARRGEQLPLNPDEAVIAAYAARLVGNPGAESRYLGLAAGHDDPELAALAAVQLAALLGPADPARAVELALPWFERGPPIRVREAATEAVIAVVAARAEGTQRGSIESAARRLPRELERRLELALAETDDEHRARRLERLLEAATRDAPALAAAESLLRAEALSPKGQFLAASTLFQHGLYDRAAPLLEGLLEATDRAVSREEAAFLRGRCAFRRGRWTEAIAWYRKALALAGSAGRRAELEVHIGRSHELAGDLGAAVEAAARAVRLDTSDERRLFLARLRLRRGELELAELGLGRLRGRSARAHGEMLLALSAMRRGDSESAIVHLAPVRRGSWSAPAALFEAELMAAAGEAAEALALLDRRRASLGPYWGERARELVAQLPEDPVRQWRDERLKAVDGAVGVALWRELAQWAALEPDPARMSGIRRRVEAALAARFGAEPPAFPSGLAGELWGLGLEREAADWDPGGFPRADAAQSAWSAARFLELGLPWRALRAADEAWRQAGSEMPQVALPAALRRASLPIPDAAMLRQAAAAGSVDWSLLAGVAREESRWDPEVVSVVGARGLVQLMPATAVAIAARTGAAPPSVDDLFDPNTNLGLGAAELGRLLELFDGRRAPAVAAYNAGEVQAGIWLEQCGGVCPDARYVANISFAATRAYTAAVLAAADAYAALEKPDPPPLND
ncbi:MAG TPA: transglycosylase SLT domain-containing protein [Chondromyces sp.]|nr:transglycosylase SLT domain-containing protein [Chondromyces sp.]